MIRLFTAIALPFDAAETLARRQQGLPRARWRPPESLHVTLAFYGDVDERRADDLAAELARIPGGKFSLGLKGAGAFGDAHQTRAVWAGVEQPNEPLAVLAGRCRAAGERAGIAVERRTYRPHVTLAYLNNPDPARVAAWIANHNLLASPPLPIDRFGLYSSILTDAGSHYTLEREYPL